MSTKKRWLKKIYSEDSEEKVKNSQGSILWNSSESEQDDFPVCSPIKTRVSEDWVTSITECAITTEEPGGFSSSYNFSKTQSSPVLNCKSKLEMSPVLVHRFREPSVSHRTSPIIGKQSNALKKVRFNCKKLWEEDYVECLPSNCSSDLFNTTSLKEVKDNFVDKLSKVPEVLSQPLFGTQSTQRSNDGVFQGNHLASVSTNCFQELKNGSSDRNKVTSYVSLQKIDDSLHISQTTIDHIHVSQKLHYSQESQSIEDDLLGVIQSVHTGSSEQVQELDSPQPSQIIEDGPPLKLQRVLSQASAIIEIVPSQNSSLVANFDTENSSDRTDSSDLYHPPRKRKRYKKGGLAARLQKVLQLQRTRYSIWQHETYKQHSVCEELFIDCLVQKCWKEYGCTVLECVVGNSSNRTILIILSPVVDSVFHVGERFRFFPPFTEKSVTYNDENVVCYINVTKILLCREKCE